MNKKTLAKECANYKNPEANYSCEVGTTTGDLFNYSKDDFIAGYDAAEKQNDEFTISFAIWYAKHKIEARLSNVPMSDKELLEFYRESINK